MGFIDYIIMNRNQILSLLLNHIQLTAIAVGLSLLIGVPLGILICYVRKLSKPIIGLANVIQAIPSMAMLGFAIPFLGIGTLPAVITVVLYSLLPIIKNTYTGIANIDKDMVESARGIGLTKFQILTKVQIPIALPVIMAGVRISAVTAVGMMTIAAFIGAGGLGYLVFSGIRTVNNNQILAGAIPACLLALFVDYLAGLVEKIVTPVSLQNSERVSLALVKKRRKHQKIILAVCACMVAVLFLYTGISTNKKSDKSITIAGKDFTEQSILTHMLADMVEDRTDIEVRRESELGGTQVCMGALKTGEVDMYIEYTGTAYGDTLKHPMSSDMKKVYNTVKKEFKEEFDIEVLEQMNFNNTYTLAVRPDTAKKYNLTTISDLGKVSPNLTFGATLEFLNRSDGFPGLSEVYRINFKETVGIDGSPRYTALNSQETDVVDAFATDGLIKKFNLQVLEDDKNFFPPYYAIPVIRGEVLEKYPEIQEPIEELRQILTDEVMMELNYKVDELQMTPREVAREYLEDANLL
ncbi:osmoprotectant transport system permease protein [Aequitasia blattaphilus]|uniref:ABC transporter permease subunit n=1 Tax=Aequitasia blattaphilus TaxID=2949332 RepID=A0ABT1E6D5_9FIRM|nr:glycine betaine ABC transporter substrate-binding protein [Aequitasia blattaphilus]MCP1101401.1 ABC transporter permease subunit [Aequitasia blattaphilus]MCR8614041.1 ABC transporter permease subunit [Aequitasia blattaphilus]